MTMTGSSGCETSWQVRGRVVTGGGIPLPLSGAQVALKCSQLPTGSRALITGPDGAYLLGGSGALPLDCTIELDRRGYVSRRVNIASACTMVAEPGSCRVAELSSILELEPAPATTTAAR